MKSMKDGKAAGGDGIPVEVWKYGGVELKKWVYNICVRIWRGEGWIKEWEEGIIVPVLKKGEGNKVKEYRGVTLTSTLYKVYVGVLAERLRIEVERKGLVGDNQAGFRKGMGTTSMS